MRLPLAKLHLSTYREPVSGRASLNHQGHEGTRSKTFFLNSFVHLVSLVVICFLPALVTPARRARYGSPPAEFRAVRRQLRRRCENPQPHHPAAGTLSSGCAPGRFRSPATVLPPVPV